MNKRLEKIAEFIENGVGFVDVGTDHGYLPAHMAVKGYSGNIYAADLREGPLSSAKHTAEHYGVTDKMEFILCDGLELCPKDNIDTIVIAGMGGDNICGILDRAEWCMDQKYKLILQPMKKAEILRYWLSNNEFIIENEALVSDGGVIYQVVSARFGGVQLLNEGELYTGKYELIHDDPLFFDYLKVQIRRFENTLAGLKLSGLDQYKPKIALCSHILAQLREMEK